MQVSSNIYSNARNAKSVRKALKLNKLTSSMQRALTSNPYDLPELGGVSTAPTGTQVQITFPSTAPTGGRYYAAAISGAVNVDKWANFYGTPKAFGANGDHVQCQTGTTSAATAGAGANINNSAGSAFTNGKGSMFGVEVMTDSLSPTLKIVGGGGNPYFRIIVDGQYVIKTPGALTTIPGNRFVTLTFSSRKLRRIKLELEQDAAFDGIFISQLEQVFKLPERQLIRAAVLMDSYGVTSVGSPTTPMWDGPVGVAAKLLGWDDLRNSSIAGTGWVNPGAAWTFGSHVEDINVNPDVILLGGCFNDNAYPLASITANVASGLAAVRNANPTTPIIMLGVWTPPVISPALALSVEAAQLAGYTQAASSLTSFVPLANRSTVGGLSGSESIFFGTGSDVEPAGNGNSDLYIKGDKTHPNAAGYPYVGRLIANAIRSSIMNMEP
jgi:hypothetical protein